MHPVQAACVRLSRLRDAAIFLHKKKKEAGKGKGLDLERTPGSMLNMIREGDESVA